MVVDTSALLAIFLNEPEGSAFARALASTDPPLMSVVSKLEASMVALARGGDPMKAELDRLFSQLRVNVIPFDERQADIASDAFARYGKGRHRAGLNFGDCASYALAMAEGEPLLFKGTDFGATDVAIATPE